jgi:excisionase family DNA binding protein
MNENPNNSAESEVCPSNQQQQPEVLTVDEVAALLRVNRKTVYEAIRRSEFPGARRIGGTIRICRRTVLAWLAEGQPSVSRSSRSPR